MNDVDSLKKLIRAFPAMTEALEPESPLYVAGLHLEGEAEKRDPVLQFANYLALCDAPMITLFSGLIGTGKSTELLRLQKMLWDTYKERAFVLNMADYVHLSSPIDISDLLISIVAALSELVLKETGKDPVAKGSKLEGFVNLIESEVSPKEIELNTWLIKIKAALKTDLGFKLRVQEKLKSQEGKLFNAAQSALSELHQALQNRYSNEASYVLILDSLEQLQEATIESNVVKDSLVYLYSHYLNQLYLPGFKVVYSVPSYLLSFAPQLTQRLGTICRLTNVHLFKDHSLELDRDGGVALLTDIVHKRTLNIAPLSQLFAPEVLDLLLQSSGGDLRTVFTMIRQCALFAISADLPKLPMTLSDAKGALSQIRNSQGTITSKVAKRLAYIHEHHQPNTDDDDALKGLAEDLYTKRVMVYKNGSDWYQVLPLLWPSLNAYIAAHPDDATATAHPTNAAV